ncbi:MAG TPA: ribulose-phosphate 3-epimerase [Candidatus Blautia merdigallinarum]|uniref:Ribulose-phosphate 3-epimerase n=1 Tax=Candidatus Blautia merdigallinarum TaxID=2838495 RepID=A0A9D2SKC6_9FIRM|nr:ribulose-phosphate 3-epimerase [Candidatus Blautia merdigallinarum]
MEYQLCPSILAADFWRLGEEITQVEKAGVQWLHIDIMDGHFVPTVSMGVPVVASVRKASGLFLDVHIMAEEPSHLVKEFAKAGADMITIHAEACVHLDRTLRLIHEQGCKAGIAINPATPVSILEEVLELADMVLIMTVNPGFGGQKYISYCTDKIRRLREMAKSRGKDLDIEVDGGINRETIRTVLEAGANVIVAGSAVFGGDIQRNVKDLKGIIEEYEHDTGLRR